MRNPFSDIIFPETRGCVLVTGSTEAFDISDPVNPVRHREFTHAAKIHATAEVAIHGAYGEDAVLGSYPLELCSVDGQYAGIDQLGLELPESGPQAPAEVL